MLDVTNPAAVSVLKTCDLVGNHQVYAVYALGNTLYVGRDTVPGGGSDLLSLDISDPTNVTFCTPTGQADVSDFYSRKVLSIKASGSLLFVATTNTTDAHGEIQVRPADPATNFSPVISTFSIPSLLPSSIDVDGDNMYTAAATSPQLQVLYSPN